MCYNMSRFEKAAEEKKRRQTKQKLELFVAEPEKIQANTNAKDRKAQVRTS